MRTDAISKIQSQPTLRYIVYELILYSCQQNAKGGKKEVKEEVSGKMYELLGEMKCMLGDMMSDNE